MRARIKDYSLYGNELDDNPFPHVHGMIFSTITTLSISFNMVRELHLLSPVLLGLSAVRQLHIFHHPSKFTHDNFLSSEDALKSVFPLLETLWVSANDDEARASRLIPMGRGEDGVGLGECLLLRIVLCMLTERARFFPNGLRLLCFSALCDPGADSAVVRKLHAIVPDIRWKEK